MPNNQDAVKLLPCPFCGGEAYEGYDDCSYGDYVECSDCLTKVRNLTFSSINPQPDAATVWQRRAPTPREQELEAVLDEARKALADFALLFKSSNSVAVSMVRLEPKHAAVIELEQALAAINKVLEK